MSGEQPSSDSRLSVLRSVACLQLCVRMTLSSPQPAVDVKNLPQCLESRIEALDRNITPVLLLLIRMLKNIEILRT